MENVTQYYSVSMLNETSSGLNISSTGGSSSVKLSVGDIIAVTILFLLATVGTIGNLLIIYAVVTQQELRRMTGNTFICNLAVADLIVTALLLPLTALNLINGNESFVSPTACAFVGFMLPLSCNASIQNLMFISVQRPLNPVSKMFVYKDMNRGLMVTTAAATSKQNILKSHRASFLVAVFVWLWTIMMTSPVLIPLPKNGQMLLIYDHGASMCAWDDLSEPRFKISMIILAFFIPVIISMGCYWLLFQRVKRRAMEISRRSKSAAPQMQKRETRLLKTILIVLICFLVSWAPYCVSILLSAFGVVIDVRNTAVKRPLGWLGMFNSTVNSFIYGWRNENFRRGYISCMLQIGDVLTCNRYRFQRRYQHQRKKRHYGPNHVCEVK